jgi:hypothetical protein
VRGPEFARRLATAAAPVRRGFAAFTETLPPDPRDEKSRAPGW